METDVRYSTCGKYRELHTSACKIMHVAIVCNIFERTMRYQQQTVSMHVLPCIVQVAVPSQPLSVQVTVLLPDWTYPVLQLKDAVCPRVVPEVALKAPFAMANVPQSVNDKGIKFNM